MLTSRVQRSRPDWSSWLPLLGDVLGLEVPETPATADLDDEFRKARLEAVVVDLLRAAAARADLLTVDDAQHMDPAVGRPAQQARVASHGAPVAARGQPRDQPVGWIPADELESVELRVAPAARRRRHAPGAHRSRATRCCHDPRSPPSPSKAGGNPLFLQSLVTQRRAGRVGRGAYRGRSRTSWRRRSTSSPPPLAASCAMPRCSDPSSRRPSWPVCCPIWRTRSTTTCTTSSPTSSVPADGGVELRFRHGLIREVAYQGLAYRARRRMHDQVGLAMERTQAAARPGLLSFHFLNAGRYDKAWTYARTAASRPSGCSPTPRPPSSSVGRSRRRGGSRRARCPRTKSASCSSQLGDCWFTIGSTTPAADAYRQAHRHVRGDLYASARLVAKEAMVDRRLRKFPRRCGGSAANCAPSTA